MSRQPDKTDLYGLTRSQLVAWLVERGCSAAHALPIWRAMYGELASAFSGLVELPRAVRVTLEREAELSRPHVARETDADAGRTQKYLLALADGQQIETVLMRCRERVTACVSSQAGCALGCVFCATGQMGFGRDLTAGEIVAQAVHVARELAASGAPEERLRNIVFMGMGEPLVNYDAVLRAVEILGDPGGAAIAGKRLTISTVGIVPGIIRLADEGRRCSLAVSLHAATQAERAALLPIARAWPLDALMDACRYYARKLERRIFFEWTLIAGTNDTPEQAHTLAELLRGIPAQVNLIPLNATDGYDAPASSRDATARFRTILAEHGLPVSIRYRRGIEIGAGCGQLAIAEAT